MLKKTGSFILALVLMLGLLPTLVFAETNPASGTAQTETFAGADGSTASGPHTRAAATASGDAVASGGVPTNVGWDNNYRASFTGVAGAEEYPLALYCNNVRIYTTNWFPRPGATEISFDFVPYITKSGTYYYTVGAIIDGSGTLVSSNTVTYTKPSRAIGAPQNVKFTSVKTAGKDEYKLSITWTNGASAAGHGYQVSVLKKNASGQYDSCGGSWSSSNSSSGAKTVTCWPGNSLSGWFVAVRTLSSNLNSIASSEYTMIPLSGSGSTPTPTPTAGKLTLNATYKLLASPKQAFTLKLYNDSKAVSAAKAKWSSNSPSVASVSAAGKVTAIKAGTAKITAKYGTKSVVCTIKVGGVPVKGVKLYEKGKTAVLARKTIAAGKTVSLVAKLNPVKPTNSKLTWASSNTSVATVSKTGLVRGTSKGGTATITVTTQDGSFKATCKITVTPAK